MSELTEAKDLEEQQWREGEGNITIGVDAQNYSAEQQNISQEDSQLLPRKGKANKKTGQIEDEFSCSVCLRLVVQPTTLTCGHTTCRLCLAQWYFNSKKKECPLCRCTYHGHPQVNTQIKNLLESLSPETMLEREKEVEEDDKNNEILNRYDEELSQQNTSVSGQSSDVASFCSGIIVAISLFIVAYLAWYWQSADSSLLVNKPVQSWKPRDVASWLEELGWAAQYSNHVEEHQIDGTMLLAFDENGLHKHLNISDETHDRALMLAINILAETGLKPPVTLWEFKAIYPGRALFLVFGLKDFPRTTILYLYVYFYEDLFLPFLQATTGAEGLSQYSDTKVQDPSIRQWVRFVLCTMVVPQWLVAVFAWQMFQHHVFTPLFVLASAFFYTVLELLDCLNYVNAQEHRATGTMVKSYLKQLTSCFIFMVFWPLVPSLVCDMFFYGALYVGPLHASSQLYDKLVDRFNRDHVQDH